MLRLILLKLRTKDSEILLSLSLSLLSLCVIISFVFLVSCASVPDVVVCADKGDSGFCRWTLTDESFRLEGKEWEEFQDGRFSMSPKGFSKYQSFIEKTCSTYENFCQEGAKEKIENLKKSLSQGRMIRNDK